MRLLFIGDIVGRPGRQLIKTGLQALVSRHDVDFVIANGENSAAGFGITREIGDELLELGVDVLTSGNHIWDKKEALDFIGTEPRLPPNTQRQSHADGDREDANPGGGMRREAWHDRKAEKLEGLWGGTWYEHRALAVKARSRADEGPRSWAKTCWCVCAGSKAA
jgi:hypothetical protein